MCVHVVAGVEAIVFVMCWSRVCKEEEEQQEEEDGGGGNALRMLSHWLVKEIVKWLYCRPVGERVKRVE